MPLVSSSTPSSRSAARALIVQRDIFKVNAHRRRWRWNAGVMTTPTLLSMRQLQLAVCICRRNGLVDNDVLDAAGFRGTVHRSTSLLAAA